MYLTLFNINILLRCKTFSRLTGHLKTKVAALSRLRSDAKQIFTDSQSELPFRKIKIHSDLIDVKGVRFDFARAVLHVEMVYQNLLAIYQR